MVRIREFSPPPPPEPEFWPEEYTFRVFLGEKIPVFQAAPRLHQRLLTHYEAAELRHEAVYVVRQASLNVILCDQGEVALALLDRGGALRLLRSRQERPPEELRELLVSAVDGLIGGSQARLAVWDDLVHHFPVRVAVPVNWRSRFFLAAVTKEPFVIPPGIYYSFWQPPFRYH